MHYGYPVTTVTGNFLKNSTPRITPYLKISVTTGIEPAFSSAPAHCSTTTASCNTPKIESYYLFNSIPNPNPNVLDVVKPAWAPTQTYCTIANDICRLFKHYLWSRYRFSRHYDIIKSVEQFKNIGEFGEFMGLFANILLANIAICM